MSLGSHNEWNQLEDVIVGRVENARFPAWDFILRNTVPPEAVNDYENIFKLKGMPIPETIINKINTQLDIFISILKDNNVNVRRPELFDFSKAFGTNEWTVASGVSSANPRDVILIIGKKIIECPMADRGRYFEIFPYRKILMELNQNGYEWIAAPRPRLEDKTYSCGNKFSIQNDEPLFDAADFVRCGNILIGQLSHVTNQKGINWLRQQLNDDIELRVITSKCTGALHIDTTLIPIANKTLLINPEFVDIGEINKLFSDWKIIIAPKPESFFTEIGEYRIVSDWMSMNILSINDKTIIVEEKQKNLQAILIKNGFRVISCPFESYYILGGSFHCATLDIRRSHHD